MCLLFLLPAPPPINLLTNAPGPSTITNITTINFTTANTIVTTNTTIGTTTTAATASNIITNVGAMGSKMPPQPTDPVQVNVQPIQAPNVTTQPNIPTQANIPVQASSIKTQPTVPPQQTILSQQQLHYQHSISQQQQQEAQLYNAHPSVNQSRQPFSMYQMSQQAVRPQQYMMGQHYLAQPTKVPFIQQHPNQQHIMMAQNSVLQHQMQNAPISVNQHETTHHLAMQHASALMSELSGMCTCICLINVVFLWLDSIKSV